MTTTDEKPGTDEMIVPKFDEGTDRKLCIICSKGTLDMAYPGMVLGNAALMEGIEVHMFFTFWGLDIINKKTMEHLKVTPVGNTAMHMPQALGPIPGVASFATHMMKKQIEELGVPPIDEFLQQITDAGGHLYGCKMSADMMKLTTDDLFDGVEGIISATDFIELSAGAQIIFV